MRRYPRRLTLPFGYQITFAYCTAAQMREKGCQDADGCWEVETRTISIRRRLPAKRLRYIIGHELDHAINDYRHFIADAGIAQN